MSETRAEKLESPAVSVGLVTLISLPCLLSLLVLEFFDGPGEGDRWSWIFYVMTAVCSAGSALGFARLFGVRGVTRVVTIALLGVALFAISWFVTFFWQRCCSCRGIKSPLNFLCVTPAPHSAADLRSGAREEIETATAPPGRSSSLSDPPAPSKSCHPGLVPHQPARPRCLTLKTNRASKQTLHTPTI